MVFGGACEPERISRQPHLRASRASVLVSPASFAEPSSAGADLYLGSLVEPVSAGGDDRVGRS
jgi:hypothetical protein